MKKSNGYMPTDRDNVKTITKILIIENTSHHLTLLPMMVKMAGE